MNEDWVTGTVATIITTPIFFLSMHIPIQIVEGMKEIIFKIF